MADPCFLPVTGTTIVVILVLRIIRIVRSNRYNKNQYSMDVERWTRTWGCVRCGNAFTVDGALG